MRMLFVSGSLFVESDHFAGYLGSLIQFDRRLS